MMDRTIVRIPAYVAFGFAVFLVALVLTFPDERLKQIATVQIESQVGNEYDVEIEDLDLWWLSGVELENVTLTERADTSDDDTSDKDSKGDSANGSDGQKPDEDPDFDEGPTQIKVQRIAAGFAPLGSLFNFAPTVDFLVDLGGGNIRGNYVHGSDGRQVNVNIDDIDLKQTTVLESVLGVPVLGTLGGEISLDLHPARPLLTGGHITLNGEQLMIDEATIQSDEFGPMAFIDVPSTSLGNLDARMVIEKGGNARTPSLQVEEFRFHGGRDVRGQVWGDVDLAERFGSSRPKLQMRFQFAEKYVRDNDLSSVLRIKWFRDGKNEDWYGFVLMGRMSKPRFEGAPSAGRGPDAAPSPEEAAKPKKPGPPNKPGPPDKRPSRRR
ncbi:MAG: type II secretion system protein GspN [Persicimonas sp.]